MATSIEPADEVMPLWQAAVNLILGVILPTVDVATDWQFAFRVLFRSKSIWNIAWNPNWTPDDVREIHS